MFDAAILCAPGMKAHLHLGPHMAFDLCKGLLHPRRKINLERYITPYLSHNDRVAKQCARDGLISMDLSLCNLLATQSTKRRSLKRVESIAPNMPILILAGQDDKVLKTNALSSLVKRIGSKRVCLCKLSGKGHLLLESQEIEPDVRNRIDQWLAETFPGSHLLSATKTKTP